MRAPGASLACLACTSKSAGEALVSVTSDARDWMGAPSTVETMDETYTAACVVSLFSRAWFWLATLRLVRTKPRTATAATTSVTPTVKGEGRQPPRSIVPPRTSFSRSSPAIRFSTWSDGPSTTAPARGRPTAHSFPGPEAETADPRPARPRRFLRHRGTSRVELPTTTTVESPAWCRGRGRLDGSMTSPLRRRRPRRQTVGQDIPDQLGP